jgi:hypothetical protein
VIGLYGRHHHGRSAWRGGNALERGLLGACGGVNYVYGGFNVMENNNCYQTSTYIAAITHIMMHPSKINETVLSLSVAFVRSQSDIHKSE